MPKEPRKTFKKPASNARKISTVPTENWVYAVVEPRSIRVSNRPKSQAHQTNVYVLVNGVHWRKAPPTEEPVLEIRRSRQGNLLFPDLAVAVKSGLGDQGQLAALAAGEPYTGQTVTAAVMSAEDMEFIEQELRLGREFDNEYRVNELRRRLWSVLAILRNARDAGDPRPHEIVREQRRIDRELASLYTRRREFKQQNRSRAEPTDLDEQIDERRNTLKALREEFNRYYPKAGKSPTPKLDEQIKRLDRFTNQKATVANMAREGYQPSLKTIRCEIENAISKRVARFDFSDGKGPVKVTREILKARLADVEKQERANREQLAKLRAKRGKRNRAAAVQERHCALNLTTYKAWKGKLTAGTRGGIREKYGNNTSNPKLSRGAPPRTRITDKACAAKGVRYRLVEEGEGSMTVSTKDVTRQQLVSGSHTLVGLTLDRGNPTHGVLRLKTTFRTIQLPIKYHRDLPADAVIKTVRVKREKDASKMRSLFHRNDGYRLSVIFTVESKTFETPTVFPGALCAIAPSFKLLPNGDLRVGVFADSNGYCAEMIFPYDARSLLLIPIPGPNGRVKMLGTSWETRHKGRANDTYVDRETGETRRKAPRMGIYASLQHADWHHMGTETNKRKTDEGRDRYLENMRDKLVKWIAANPTLVPGWLQARCKWLNTLKSPGGLTVIAYLFMNHIQDQLDPYEGLPLREIRIKRRPTRREIGEKARGALEILKDLWLWTYEDRHHAQHEAGNRGRALRHRLDTYRCFMKWVLTHYTSCKIQNIAVSKLLRKNSGLEDVQRRQEKTVAVGEMAKCSTRAAQKQGGQAGYVEAPSGYEWAPSDSHHLCGMRTNSKDLDLTICPHCKVSVDRDLNAALNTLTVPDSWLGSH